LKDIKRRGANKSNQSNKLDELRARGSR
jgi:hypothetical protein